MQEQGRFADAAELVSYLAPDEPQTLNRVCELSARGAHRDTGAATAWIESLPAGPMKDWASYNAAEQWARSNRSAAEAWLKKLGDSFDALPPVSEESSERN